MRIRKVIFLLQVLALLASKPVFAQYPGMAEVQQQINAQQRMQNQMMNFRLGSAAVNYFVNNQHTFTVTLKDGNKKEVVSKIYTDTTLHKNYLLYKDKNLPKNDPQKEQKIFPSQTLGITRHPSGGSSPGIPTDSCWLFKVISGPISAYSFLSETGIEFHPSTIVGVQVNKEPVSKLNADLLKKLLASNAKSLKLIEDKNYFKAIKQYNKDLEKAE